jgi:peptidoglycan/LPS O-acetylase OafA/YrhL
MPMTFFTVLSGFIRTTTNRESQGFAVKASVHYAIKVVARFGPPYWLALVALAFIHNFPKPLLAWPVQAAFLQSLMPVKMYGYTGPVPDYFPSFGNMVGWFTSVVVICSCVFPGVFNLSLWIGTHEKKWRGVVCILALLALRKVVVDIVGADRNVYARSLEFFMGILTAQICSLMDEDSVLWLGWGWMFDGLIIGFITIPYLVAEGPWETNSWNSGIVPTLAPLFWCFLVTSAWAAAQHAGLQGKPASGLLGKLVSLWPITSLAEYSFGAYIYQMVAASCFQKKVFEQTCGTASAPFLLSWGMAVASDWLLEKHCRF